MVEQLAHDLKNPLAALLGALEVIERQMVGSGSIERGNKMFQLLRPQAERIGAVLDRYLQVAQISPQRTVDDLGPIVRDAVAAVEAEARKDVLVELELDATLPRANIDRELIRSALDNLTRNALQAMPNGGTLTIRALRDEDRDILRAVALEVRDTGHGMDPRVLERAGEEFFSTRPDGSGFGLPFAQRVATAHGGKRKIESTLGEGTTVRMILPST
jgi:signal transduction histidine kinase